MKLDFQAVGPKLLFGLSCYTFKIKFINFSWVGDFMWLLEIVLLKHKKIEWDFFPSLSGCILKKQTNK
jgi:hypothetical protein